MRVRALRAAGIALVAVWLDNDASLIYTVASAAATP